MVTALRLRRAVPVSFPVRRCRQQAIDEVGTPACSWASLGCDQLGSGTGGMSPVSIDGAEACTGQGKPLGVPVLPRVLCLGRASVHACLRRSPRIFFKLARNDSSRLGDSSQGQRCPGWRSSCRLPSFRKAIIGAPDVERVERESVFVRLCHILSAGRVCRCPNQSRFRGGDCLARVLGGTKPGQVWTWRS